MSLLSWIGKRIGLGASSAPFWSTYYGGENWAGETVTPGNANSIASVYRGTNLYSGTIGSLPVRVYRVRADGEAEIDNSSEYAEVLAFSPNDEQTLPEFYEGLVGCETLVGNGYARLKKSGDRVVALQTIEPQACRPRRDNDTNRLYYEVTDWRGRQSRVSPEEILHFKGFAFGGDEGLSVVQLGRQTMAAARAAEKISGKMLRTGLSTSGFVETGQVLQEPDRDRLNKLFAEFMGSDNAGKLMLLEGGMTYKQTSISPADAQLLLSRYFSIEEIARWLGMPPVLLGHSTQGQTMWGTGLEAIIRAWYQLGLGQKITRLERALNKRVIRAADRKTYYVKFNVDALLRGDSAAQAALFSAALQNGWMTRAEVRRLLELPYMPGTDDLTAQVNLVPVQMLGDNAQQAQRTEATRQALIVALRNLGGPGDGIADRISGQPALPPPS